MATHFRLKSQLIALLNNAREAVLEGVPNQPKITIVATSDSADIAKIVVVG